MRTLTFLKKLASSLVELQFVVNCCAHTSCSQIAFMPPNLDPAAIISNMTMARLILYFVIEMYTNLSIKLLLIILRLHLSPSPLRRHG